MREEAPIKILKNNYKYNQKSTMSMEALGFHIFNEIDWAVWIQSNSKETEEDTLKRSQSQRNKNYLIRLSENKKKEQLKLDQMNKSIS